ncbi:SPX domain-containing protein 5-like isoform X2 [Zingiber officinale]|uniref:SPX domain-containing protein 5-like isoform X2 n=1 Tax=Zingiber officinale TaxID=94328 RepID=UPI001C4B7295|nr:SPX domain-containing protein 5-like isoform X2 [Zingiber officinale]
MKFGKRLKEQIEETLPAWRGEFLSYKDLKQLVKLIPEAQPCSKVEAEFIDLLNFEIDKLNAFFVGREEEFIIRQREMIKRVAEMYQARGREEEYAKEMSRIRKEIVNLHGEMVLLENYSSINYIGLAKILKKYDKRSGRLLRLLFIEKILKQPFFTTDLISKLVKECESMIDLVFPSKSDHQQLKPEDKRKLVGEEQSIFRSTVVALVTMQEMRKGSSTYGQFSLPPLSLPDNLLQSLQPTPIPIP